MHRLLLQFFILILTVIRGIKSDSEICQYRDSCSLKKNGILNDCNCGDECNKRKFCCTDYFKTKLKRLPLNSPLFLENCMPQTSKETHENETNRSIMIDTCRETKTPCQVSPSNLQSLLPVSYKGMTYINAECAICNNVDNFESWDIVYVIENIEDLVMETGETRGNLNETYVAEQILQPKSKSIAYYLQPPTDFKPRACPFEIWNDMKLLNIQERLARNLTSCNTVLFKDYDTCLDDACCSYELGKCSALTSPIGQTVDAEKLIPNSVRVFFDFTGEMQDSDTSQNTQIKDPTRSVEFQGIGVTILIEVKLVMNESLMLDNCVHGIMAYLRAAEFQLVPKHGNYIQYLREAEYLFSAEFESPLKLSPFKVNDLLNYRSSIGYMERSSESKADVILSTLRDPLLIKSLGLENKKTVTVDARFQPLPKLTRPCLNISLVLDGSHNETRMDIKCMDMKELEGDNFVKSSQVGTFDGSRLLLLLGASMYYCIL